MSELQLAKEQDGGHCTAGSQKREVLLVALHELLKCSCVGAYRPAITCHDVLLPIFQHICTDIHFTWITLDGLFLNTATDNVIPMVENKTSPVLRALKNGGNQNSSNRIKQTQS